MKEIRLKPGLMVGEPVMCNGQQYEVARSDSGRLYLTAPGEFDIYLDVMCPSSLVPFNAFDVIESPDKPKCKHDFSASIADEGTGCYSCQHCGAQPTQEEFNEILRRDAIQKPALDFDTLPERICKEIDRLCNKEKPVEIDAFGNVKGHTHMDTEIGRIYTPEEKPPLKLRVGGSYKNRKGKIVNIINTRIPPPYLEGFTYVDEEKKSYRENGTWAIYDDNAEWHDINDLIEEVQQEEKPQLKLKVGRVYKNRMGDVKAIKEYSPSVHHKYHYSDQDDFSYQENGLYGEIGDHPYDLIEEVTQRAQKESENKYDYPIKVGDNINYTQQGTVVAVHPNGYYVSFTDRETFIRKDQAKPSGNPFKVGDYIYARFDDFTFTFKVIEINGEFVKVHNYWLHYKQCELVGE